MLNTRRTHPRPDCRLGPKRNDTTQLLSIVLMTGVVLATLLLGTPSTARTNETATAFIDVNVLPMDSERLLEHQTVITSGRAIKVVGPTKAVAIPRGVRRIRASGLWLVPGLADMHTHVDNDAELSLFVHNGVTSALHMGGADGATIRARRQAIFDGRLVGPNLYYALLLDGVATIGAQVIRTAAEAHDPIARGKAQGFDFLKVYNSLSAEAFDAIVREGKDQSMAVIGHGVRAVGLPHGLTRGQVMVAHAEEFFYTAFGNRPAREMIPRVVKETKESGAWVTPNLSGFGGIVEQWGRPAVARSYLRKPYAAGLSSKTRESWESAPYGNRKGDLRPMLQFLQEFTKALSDADVPLLAGTDTPFIPGMAPGFSLHGDLDILVRSGLTPYQALSAATRSPGAFIIRTIPNAEPFGQVREGMRADLVLVTLNPLINLSSLRTPRGVMVAGRWFAIKSSAPPEKAAGGRLTEGHHQTGSREYKRPHRLLAPIKR